ncbi:MAG: SH3 domain-containing protein [Lautropia sp.]
MRAAAVALVALAATGALSFPGQGFAQPQQPPSVIRPSSTLGPPVGRGAAGEPSGTARGGAASGTAAATGGKAPAAGVPAARPVPAQANRFRSIAKDETLLFDAPSERAKKLYVAPAGMPVEVVSVLRNWVKIRDSVGDLAWVERDTLTDRRMVISLGQTPVQREPSVSAGSLFDVDGGVVLELLDDRLVSGYAKVRYASGEIGYVQASQVWGL